jgi:DNA-binding transcriptional MocR family regulator
VNDKDFRRPGGVIALPRVMVKSPAYRALSLPAKALIVELQNRWAPSREAIDFATRDAATALNVSQSTACRAFKQLASRGFIELAKPANHGGRKARGWRLTWNSHKGREPTDEWATNENLAIHQETAKAVCESPGNRDTKPRNSPKTKNQRLTTARDSPGNRETAVCESPGNHII